MPVTSNSPSRLPTGSSPASFLASASLRDAAATVGVSAAELADRPIASRRRRRRDAGRSRPACGRRLVGDAPVGSSPGSRRLPDRATVRRPSRTRRRTARLAAGPGWSCRGPLSPTGSVNQSDWPATGSASAALAAVSSCASGVAASNRRCSSSVEAKSRRDPAPGLRARPASRASTIAARRASASPCSSVCGAVEFGRRW